MGFLAVQTLSGLAAGSVLFLIASGLSIIFGVTRIVNFAHGSFTMLGAYLAVSMIARLGGGALGFWLGIALAALTVGVLGAVLERLLLRRLYQSPELFALLATFGVVLAIQDAALFFWGPEDLLGPRAPGLSGTIAVLGQRFPVYDLVLIALGPIVLGLLHLLFHRTRWGICVRAATQDRLMTAALGVNPHRLFSGVLFLGSALAGLGGALQVPREAITLQMDLATVIEAFVVVVVGGMGSIGGAFVAAMMIGELQAFGILVFPRITLVLVFLVMALVLALRPHGLFGRAEAMPRGASAAMAALAPSDGHGLRYSTLALLAGLILLPLVVGNYGLVVVTEILILALFAASLHFLLAVGGMISFGHAAFFGIGCYASALLASRGLAPMLPALAVAPLAAALAAALAGWFCVRLGGVYMAMLTLAFAQIAWSAGFQWTDLTGGDNGLLGLRPAEWVAGRAGFYWLTLGMTVIAWVGLRRAVAAPFGFALAASRDSELRALAIGIPVLRVRWAGFVLAGTVAGLAGGLYAYAKGSVFPSVLAIPTSVDALAMVLLGGLSAATGPLLGTTVFQLLHTELMRHTEYWRLLFGLAIITLVVACPLGLAGIVSGLRSRAIGRGGGR